MKSSNSRAGAAEAAQPVVVATGLRLRGARGHLTARMVPGGVDQLAGRDWVLVGGRGAAPGRYAVESASHYRDRVVVKFAGVDSAEAAADLVGRDILIPCNGLVDLPEGDYYIFQLIGLRVRTRQGREIGIVRDVLSTGGAPLLAVAPPQVGHRGLADILIPAARSICTHIDPAAGEIVIDPPEGLLEL